MGNLNDDQKQIAKILLMEPKTIEDMHKLLGIPYDKLQHELKEMLNAKLVDKGGFPTKYSIRKEIAENIMKRKEISSSDKNKLRLKAIIEAQGIEETILEKELKKIEESLRKEKGFTIYDIALAKTVKSGEHYSSYLDVSLSVKDFRSLVRLMFFYGPVSVEVIKPEKLELTADDLQDAIVDMGEMIQSYNNYIMKSMKKEEIEKFNQKMYKQAAKAE